MNPEPISAGGARAAEPAAHTAPRKRLHSYGLLGRSIAEGVGSFLLVFATAVAIFSGTGGVSSPLGVGLAAAAAMVAFGYVSGGHFNPAISLGSAAAGRTSWKALPVYVVAQLIGALLAYLILWVLFQGHPELTDTRQIFSVLANGYGTDYQLGFPLASALLAEVVATALLVAVFLGASARRIPAVSAAFAVGVTYAVLLSILAPITGGSLNPARSTAAAIFAGGDSLEQLWLFWAAPVLGALIAGLIYRSVHLSVSDAQRGDDTDEDADLLADEADGADDANELDDADVEEAKAQHPSGTATGTVAGASAAAPTKMSRENDEDARGFFDGDDDGGRPGTGRR
ncbi:MULTISPECIES: MIP/aquaporin family protein [unclassified Arthrobacter]|uniref:MIP/aquaporin family protein n=1 Tax=unclassified Arthrobacter TaxID=235627 RepID=UPI000CE2C440|nr:MULTISPECIES: aquaporin [unclassified Arthrobacter]